MIRRLSCVVAGILTMTAAVAETDPDRLSRAAESFAASGMEDLVTDNQPRLKEAYPLVVDHYYAGAGPYDALPEPEPLRIEACATHYADTWLGQRFWWPMDESGAPDWPAIYVHILDHYFGYCLQRPQL
jgi:hypothetical protein